jgi:hypothetical protein
MFEYCAGWLKHLNTNILFMLWHFVHLLLCYLLMSIVRVESKQKKTYLDGFFVFYQSFIPLAYISPGYFRNNAIPNLNSWIIPRFLWNKNGIIEKSGKQISKTKLFRHLYYSSKHTCIEFLITSTAYLYSCSLKKLWKSK